MMTAGYVRRHDDADLVTGAPVGLPFWLADGYKSAAQVDQALEAGAPGVHHLKAYMPLVMVYSAYA